MFKLEIDEQYKCKITENDRGNWQVESNDSPIRIVGYGGENVLYIFLSSMQSGITNVLIVHQHVDDYIRTMKGTARDRGDESLLTEYLNNFLGANAFLLGIDSCD